MGNTDLSKEEMQRYIEEQKKKIEEALARMTPEERAQVEKNYAALKEADDAAMRKTLDDARAVMDTAQEHHTIQNPGAYVPEAVRQIKFCPSCGAQAGSGNFCEYCGAPLNNSIK